MDRFVNDYVSLLHFLHKRCREIAFIFHEAADLAEDRELKYLFKNFSQQKKDYKEQLEHELLRYIKDVDQIIKKEKLHANGLEGDDDKLLNECLKWEEKIHDDYNRAMKEDIPGETKAVISRQFSGIRKSYDKIKMYIDQSPTHF